MINAPLENGGHLVTFERDAQAARIASPRAVGLKPWHQSVGP